MKSNPSSSHCHGYISALQSPPPRNCRGRLFGIKTLTVAFQHHHVPPSAFSISPIPCFLHLLFESNSISPSHHPPTTTLSRKVPLLFPFQEVSNTFNQIIKRLNVIAGWQAASFLFHPLLFAFIVPHVRAVNNPTPSLSRPHCSSTLSPSAPKIAASLGQLMRNEHESMNTHTLYSCWVRRRWKKERERERGTSGYRFAPLKK